MTTIKVRDSTLIHTGRLQSAYVVRFHLAGKHGSIQHMLGARVDEEVSLGSESNFNARLFGILGWRSYAAKLARRCRRFPS
jgi:hypothetical protein